MFNKIGLKFDQNLCSDTKQGDILFQLKARISTQMNKENMIHSYSEV